MGESQATNKMEQQHEGTAVGLTICVAVDGSENSFRALEKGINLVSSRGQHDRLVLLMIQPRSTLLEALVDPFDMLHIPDRQLRLFAKKKLTESELRCKEEKVRFETKIVVTDVSEREELLGQIEARWPSWSWDPPPSFAC